MCDMVSHVRYGQIPGLRQSNSSACHAIHSTYRAVSTTIAHPIDLSACFCGQSSYTPTQRPLPVVAEHLISKLTRSWNDLGLPVKRVHDHYRICGRESLTFRGGVT